MFEINTTDIIQILYTGDYYGFIYNMVTTTYIEIFAFMVGIFLYSLFIWFFYRNLAKRDLFKLDLSKYDHPEVDHKRAKKVGSVFLYILKHFIVFPFYVAFWFLVFTVFLVALTENVTLAQIAIISTALVSTVRVTSYIKEDLSNDLAKLAPFALLGVFLTDPNFFSLDLLITRVTDIPSLGWKLIHFLSFCIFLEWMLRILYSLKGSNKPDVTPEKTK